MALPFRIPFSSLFIISNQRYYNPCKCNSFSGPLYAMYVTSFLEAMVCLVLIYLELQIINISESWHPAFGLPRSLLPWMYNYHQKQFDLNKMLYGKLLKSKNQAHCRMWNESFSRSANKAPSSTASCCTTSRSSNAQIQSTYITFRNPNTFPSCFQILSFPHRLYSIRPGSTT
jgi:hypothetical protein